MGPLLLLAAVALDVWALQTYGLRPEPDAQRLVLVAFVAHLPVVGRGLRRVTSSGPPSVLGLARALLPSVLVVASCVTAVAASRDDVARPGAWRMVAAAVFGWLVVGGLVSARRRSRGSSSGWRPERRVAAALLPAAGVLLVGIGLAMPLTTRGLLEADRLGMTDQLRAVLTGYGDPVATRLVAAYAVGFGALVLLDRVLRVRGIAASSTSGPSPSPVAPLESS